MDYDRIKNEKMPPLMHSLMLAAMAAHLAPMTHHTEPTQDAPARIEKARAKRERKALRRARGE